jgi:hypothetical protein
MKLHDNGQRKSREVCGPNQEQVYVLSAWPTDLIDAKSNQKSGWL